MEGRNTSEVNWTAYREVVEAGRSVAMYDNLAGRYGTQNPFQTLDDGFTSPYEESQAMPSPIYGTERTDDIPSQPYYSG